MDRSSHASPPAPLRLDMCNTSRKPSDYFSYHNPRLSSASDSSYTPTTISSPPPPPTPRNSSWIKPSPTVNVYTTCGRHTDQLLFGGPSWTDMAKAIWKKK